MVASVELELQPKNQYVYAIDDPVALNMIVKNNPVLTVNVYEVCARNYYIQKQHEVPADVNLFGCTPIDSFEERFDDPPVIRRTRAIKINAITNRRGAFVVDIIGNGVSARAYIRKGELRYICEQVFHACFTLRSLYLVFFA